MIESQKVWWIKVSFFLSAYEKTRSEILDKIMKISTISRCSSNYAKEILSVVDHIGVNEEIVLDKYLQAFPSFEVLIIV